jgi:hypothetical protein
MQCLQRCHADDNLVAEIENVVSVCDTGTCHRWNLLDNQPSLVVHKHKVEYWNSRPSRSDDIDGCAVTILCVRLMNGVVSVSLFRRSKARDSFSTTASYSDWFLHNLTLDQKDWVRLELPNYSAIIP